MRGTSAVVDNTRIGHVTAGEGVVFHVDDLALRVGGWGNSPIPPSLPSWRFEPFSGNVLEAFDLKTGKLTWNLGTRDGVVDLRDGFFLGPPLVLGDTLLTLHEKGKTLRLLRLASRTGEVLETRPSKSRPGQGIVTFLHKAINQKGETVAQCKRSALMLGRPK